MSALVSVCASFAAEDIARIQDEAAARMMAPEEWIRTLVLRELETASASVTDAGVPSSLIESHGGERTP